MEGNISPSSSILFYIAHTPKGDLKTLAGQGHFLFTYSFPSNLADLSEWTHSGWHCAMNSRLPGLLPDSWTVMLLPQLNTELLADSDKDQSPYFLLFLA